MGNLKKYLNANVKSLVEYLQEKKDNGVLSVYNENSRQKNKTRIWISYDIDKEDRKDGPTYKKLYDWLKDKNAESWGNSVATFLVDHPLTTNEEVKEYLVSELVNLEILKAGDNEQWKGTPNISLYIFYRWHQSAVKGEKDNRNSDHFVLILNAEISRLGQGKQK